MNKTLYFKQTAQTLIHLLNKQGVGWRYSDPETSDTLEGICDNGIDIEWEGYSIYTNFMIDQEDEDYNHYEDFYVNKAVINKGGILGFVDNHTLISAVMKNNINIVIDSMIQRQTFWGECMETFDAFGFDMMTEVESQLKGTTVFYQYDGICAAAYSGDHGYETCVTAFYDEEDDKIFYQYRTLSGRFYFDSTSIIEISKEEFWNKIEEFKQQKPQTIHQKSCNIC